MSNDNIRVVKVASARYYARIVDENVVAREEWSSDLLKNAIAIALGCIIATFLAQIANSSIEYILLNNFPRISRGWCIVKKGFKQSRLRRVQSVFQYALCVVVLAMRWPGWKLLHLHVWQCVLYTIAAYAVAEFGMVMALVAMQVYLWTGNYLAWMTGWDPLLVNEKREELMVNARLEGPSALYRFRDRETGLLRTRVPRRPKQNTKDANVSTQNHRQQTVELEDTRVPCREEQRLGPSSTQPAPRTTPDDSAVVKDDIEDKFAASVGSNGTIFPEWMCGRSFRDSIFGSSLASSQSRNSPCPLPEDVAVSMIAKSGKGKDMSSSSTGVPDLLTGSPLRSRRFL